MHLSFVLTSRPYEELKKKKCYQSSKTKKVCTETLWQFMKCLS